jgi:hypothetical protein
MDHWLSKTKRWEDGEMERWRDGEMERWRDGEMERWRDGKMGKLILRHPFIWTITRGIAFGQEFPVHRGTRQIKSRP